MIFIESGGFGGAENMVLHLARSLRDREVDLSVMTLRTGGFTESLTASGIPHYKLESRRKFDFSFPFKIAKLLKENNITLLHSHLLDSYFYGALGATLAGIPHLATEHGDIHHFQERKFLRAKLLLISLLTKTRFVAVSDFTSGRLKKLGISNSRVTTIYNPVIFPTAPNQDKRRLLREQLGIPFNSDEAWLWIHVANLRPVKDQITLINSFAKSCSSLPHRLQFLAIIGDGTERSHLETQVSKLNLLDKVFFLGHRTDVMNILSAADGFVLSSLSEAMPLSLLEAAAAKLVLVATDVGGVSEIIGHNERGYISNPGDPDQLAGQLCAALENREQSARRALEAHTFVKRYCSTEVVINQYLDLYHQMTNNLSIY